MSEYESFNEKQFMILIEGDKDLFSTLLDLFEQDSPHLLNKLKKAVTEGDGKTIEQVAHRLKGNLRNFYAEDAAKMALKIEDAGRENTLSHLDRKIEELTAAIKKVTVELRNFLGTL
ncbi:MAG: hypothetical protein CL677_03770 [Bdellovibrionaceae bacterium]|nr:hypothetical protein [Pseudobdellovibrionaceae bacterium]|tara:strand:+ start:1041 stop:1391 length:351 start_codon:yes stop_codon:yes gene_type:complete